MVLTIVSFDINAVYGVLLKCGRKRSKLHERRRESMEVAAYP